jgi:hypothetical protein
MYEFGPQCKGTYTIKGDTIYLKSDKEAGKILYHSAVEKGSKYKVVVGKKSIFIKHVIAVAVADEKQNILNPMKREK